MHLIKNYKLDIPNQIRTLIKHAPENLRGHNETATLRIDLHVACENADAG
jgi:hypothetical protein